MSALQTLPLTSPMSPMPRMPRISVEYEQPSTAAAGEAPACSTRYAWAHVPQEPSPPERALLKDKIRRLLKARNAVMVSHYYVHPDLQDLADETGGTVADSLEMAVRRKPQAVDENGGHRGCAAGFGLGHQRQMAGVQVAHGGHPGGVAGADGGARGCAGVDQRGHCLAACMTRWRCRAGGVRRHRAMPGFGGQPFCARINTLPQRSVVAVA